MKKFLVFLCALMLVFGTVGVASAAYIDYTWEDTDSFTQYVGWHDTDYWYGLNIADEDDFVIGDDYVTDATLYITIRDDYDGWFGNYEYAWNWSTGAGWTSMGEVDSGTYGPYIVSGDGLDLLNETGGINLAVYSSYGDFYWTGARIVANGQKNVPEPATMLLFGTGLFGLAIVQRKRTKK